MKTFIKNAGIFTGQGVKKGNLLLDGPIIAQADVFDEDKADQVVDATGCLALPGFFDLHTHLDDIICNCNLADTYTTGSQVAVNNGITTLYSFITQKPGQSMFAAVRQALAKAKGKIWCNLGWHLSPTSFDDQTLAEVEELINNGFTSFKFYTTYKPNKLYSSYQDIALFARKFAKYNINIWVHCEDETQLALTRQNTYPNVASLTGSRTEQSELAAVQQIVDICRQTGVRFHVVHVSTAAAMRHILQNKQNLPLSCETAPQYLYLNNNCYQGSNAHQYLCTPPLRSEQTRKQLYQLVKQGAADIIATDHCPFWIEDKNHFASQPAAIPTGLTGLDWLPQLTWELCQATVNPVNLFTSLLSVNPAKLSGLAATNGALLPGYQANVVLAKPQLPAPLNTRPGFFNPYAGHTTTLKIKQVFFKGMAVKNNPSFTPQGDILCNNQPGAMTP